MSAFITLNTPMHEQDLLVTALVDLGIPRDQIEIFDEPRRLRGLLGSQGRSADVIIRRKNLDHSYGDLGFERTPTGYRMHVDDWDVEHTDAGWIDRLHARYQYQLNRREEERERQLREEARKRSEDSARRAAIQAKRERDRIDRERKALVEAQRQAIHDKAKSMGYRVTETREGQTIRMVLARRAY